MSILDDFLETLSSSSNLNLEQTLGLVLAKARRHTVAEAGSIFIVQPLGGNKKEIKACSLQNDKVDVETELFTIPINMNSIAGYVAETGEILEIEDLYELDEELPYHFNRSFDDKDGYRSKSMLAFPLKNFQGDVIGVVQLLNHISAVNDDGNSEYSPFPIDYVDDMKSVMNVLGALVERIGLIQELDLVKKELEKHGVYDIEGSVGSW